MREILCFGDSNTYGLIPGTENRFDRNTRWTGILDKHLYAKGYRIIEEGLCGRTTRFDDLTREGRNGTKMLPILLETHTPIDRVILMLGTNDCKFCYHPSAALIGRGVEMLIEQIRKVDERIKILLISPIHLGEEVWKQEFDPEFDKASIGISKQLKDVYQTIAQKYGCDFLAASDVAAPSREDQEHMDAANHKKLARLIQEVIEADDYQEAIA